MNRKEKQNMYYRLVKQEFDNGFIKRTVLTVANRECFADLKDEFSTADPPIIIMDEHEFNEILKNGYETKEDAINDKEMVQDLENFIGPWFQTEHTIIDENKLKELYKAMLS